MSDFYLPQTIQRRPPPPMLIDDTLSLPSSLPPLPTFTSAAGGGGAAAPAAIAPPQPFISGTSLASLQLPLLDLPASSSAAPLAPNALSAPAPPPSPPAAPPATPAPELTSDTGASLLENVVTRAAAWPPGPANGPALGLAPTPATTAPHSGLPSLSAAAAATAAAVSAVVNAAATNNGSAIDSSGNPASLWDLGMLGKRSWEGENGAGPDGRLGGSGGPNGWGAGLNTPEPETDDNCCMICLEEWTNEGNHRICFLPCGHVFGKQCVQQWLKRTRKCPSCKKPTRADRVRPLYGVPAKLSAADVSEIENVRKQLNVERKAHRETKMQLSELRETVRSYKKRLRAMEKCVEISGIGRENASNTWPFLKLVDSIATSGRSKAFDFASNGCFTYAEKIPGFHTFRLGHASVVRPHAVAYSPDTYAGAIMDIKTNNLFTSPYCYYSAVVSLNQRLKLIDPSHNVSMDISLGEDPLSVSWMPGSLHLIAVGTVDGNVNIYDVRRAGTGLPCFNFQTYNPDVRKSTSRGVHTLAMHEATQSLIASSNSSNMTIRVDPRLLDDAFTQSWRMPILDGSGAGLAVSNNVVVVSSRATTIAPAQIRVYPRPRFDKRDTYGRSQLADDLGEQAGSPLAGHLVRRPFARCAAMACGDHGEDGVVILSGDESTVPGRPPAYRGALWITRHLDAGLAPSWKMVRTAEDFSTPPVDFRTIRQPPQVSVRSVLGILSDNKMCLYTVNEHSP